MTAPSLANSDNASRLPTWADPARTHQNNFDFIRLALAICVVLSHSYPMVNTKNGEPLSAFIPGYTLGGIAVDGFFILSGYLITQSWVSKPQLGPFLLKRVCRVYPAFIVMMFVLAFAVVPFVHEGPRAMWRGVRVQEWFTTALTLGPYVRSDALSGIPQRSILNGAVWTVRFEGLCYLILAAGMLLGILRRRWVTLFAWLTLIAVWWYEWKNNYSGQSVSAQPLLNLLNATGLPIRWNGIIDIRTMPIGMLGGTRFLATFLAGVLFFQFRQSIPQRWFIAIASLASWVLLARYWHVPGIAAMGSAIFLPYVFLYLGFLPLPRLSRFARRGDFSYGTYLYAWPIQVSLVAGWPGIHPLMLFALAAPLSVAAGFLSWHGVEKHFLRRRHKPRGDAAARPDAVAGIVQPAPVASGTDVAL